jgi:hypothetical protein
MRRRGANPKLRAVPLYANKNTPTRAETILTIIESENDAHCDPHFRPRRTSVSIRMMIKNSTIVRGGPRSSKKAVLAISCGGNNVLCGMKQPDWRKS